MGMNGQERVRAREREKEMGERRRETKVGNVCKFGVQI